MVADDNPLSIGEQGKADDPRPLRQILSNCLDAAGKLAANVEYELSEASDMQSESTNAVVHFSKTPSSNGPLNVRLLLDLLREQTIIAAIDLFAPPQPRLVIHGALQNRSYRIVIQF